MEGKIILITGGVRSGKSRYAQHLALQMSNEPVYLATARKWDFDFEQRIKRHQSDRDDRWTNIEEEKFISKCNLANKTVVIDCVTLWLTNFFVDFKNDIDECLKVCHHEIDQLKNTAGTFIMVSNEIGMGIHAETVVGRKFADLQGWMNQYIAQQATTAILMVSGIPLIIKGSAV